MEEKNDYNSNSSSSSGDNKKTGSSGGINGGPSINGAQAVSLSEDNSFITPSVTYEFSMNAISPKQEDSELVFEYDDKECAVPEFTQDPITGKWGPVAEIAVITALREQKKKFNKQLYNAAVNGGMLHLLSNEGDILSNPEFVRKLDPKTLKALQDARMASEKKKVVYNKKAKIRPDKMRRESKKTRRDLKRKIKLVMKGAEQHTVKQEVSAKAGQMSLDDIKKMTAAYIPSTTKDATLDLNQLIYGADNINKLDHSKINKNPLATAASKNDKGKGYPKY